MFNPPRIQNRIQVLKQSFFAAHFITLFPFAQIFIFSEKGLHFCKPF